MRKGRWRVPVVRVAVLLVVGALACGAGRPGRRVKVWSLPEGQQVNLDEREEWGSAPVGSTLAGGGALENRHLVVVVRPGAMGPVLYAKAKDSSTQVQLALLDGNGAASKISKVKVARWDANEAAIQFSNEMVEAEIVLGIGSAFVKVAPGKGAGSVEVRTRARYALLPDFFADDVVYDPRKFKSASLTVPAENFLLHFVEGGNALVMCVWPGSLEAGSKIVETQNPGGDEGPQVELEFAGEDDKRHVSASRIEFLGKPVYVALLEHGNLWHEEEVSSWTGYKPTPIGWKRPFEAKWRSNLVVTEGKESRDWHTRSQSFDFWGPPKPGARPWDKRGKGGPYIWQEALHFFTYPCWFRGDETYLCLYADRSERSKAESLNKQEEREAREAEKEGRGYMRQPEVYPPNIYERVLIYPLDRKAETPISVYTPVDIMRETLGQGLCEYILDLEGIKPRAAGGERKLLAGATCALWDRHIFPIVSRKPWTKNADGKLDEKTKTHLIQALEDMRTFIHAVHDRIREYQRFSREMLEFCESQSLRLPELKALAARIVVQAQALQEDVSRAKYKGPGSEEYWHNRCQELIDQVEAGHYQEVGTISNIRSLGGYQDKMVARCRRYVKGIRQEASLVDVSNPELRAFALKLRAMCQQILRRKHPKEGL